MIFDTGNPVSTSIKSVLIVTLVLSTAGCTSISDLDGVSSDDSTPECKLTHEVVEPSGDYADVTETYTYENLSSDAQHAFEKAVAEGGYSTTNRSLKSSEFRYWDTTTAYNVTYRNETYKLLTYASGKCE